MVKRLLTTLALVLLAPAVFAQSIMDRVVLQDYNLNSTTLIYVCLSDPSNQAGTVRTVQGGGTTLTALGGASFGSVAVGDVIIVSVGTTQNRLLVSAKPSASTVTVPSVDLYNGGTGYAWTLAKLTSGTGADTCWVDVSQFPAKQIVSIDYTQGDLTGGLSFRVEGKSASPGSRPRRIYPNSATDCVGVAMTYSAGYCNIPTASAGSIDASVDVNSVWPYAKLRVGLIIPTADPSDAGVNIEQISITMRAENPR